MRLQSTRTMLMRLLSKRMMVNEVAKHMHIGKWVAKHRTMANDLNTITMTNELAKYKNNANEAAKQ